MYIQEKNCYRKNFTQLCIVKLQTRYRLESPLKKVVVASSSEKFVYTNPGLAHGQSRKSLVSRKYPSSKHTDEWAFTKNKGRAAWPYTDTLSRKLEHIIILLKITSQIPCLHSMSSILELAFKKDIKTSFVNPLKILFTCKTF